MYSKLGADTKYRASKVQCDHGAEEMGVEAGEVRIDWMEVVAEMGIDLLLY
jgi:hypothetical protein